MTNNPEEEEDEEEIVSENMYNSDVMDPLSDPLAIDDVVINQTEEDGSEFASGNTTLTELDSSGEGQIILVDVNSLKNAFPTAIPAVPYESCGSNMTYGMSSNNSNSNNIEPIALALADDEIEGVRSDGSDSGLGLELSAGLLHDKANASSSGKHRITIPITISK